MVLEQGQVLVIKEKITYLPPDEWLILESVETKHRTYYRIQLNSCKQMRPIAILNQNDLEQALKDGKIELGKLRKIKYVKEKEK